MSYIDVLNKAEDQVTPGMSACQGCGGELVLRTVLKIAGENTIVGIPPGCMAGGRMELCQRIKDSGTYSAT